MKAQWSKHYLWIVPQLWQWWLSIIKGMTTISGAAPQPQSNWHQERIFPWYSFSSYPTPSTLTRETYFLVRGRLGLDFGSWEASSCSPQLCQCSLHSKRGDCWCYLEVNVLREIIFSLFPYEEVFSKTYLHLVSAYLPSSLLLCVNTYPQNLVEFFKPGV